MSTGFEQPPRSMAGPEVDLSESPTRPSIGDLLSDISQDLTTLLRQEVELAKVEVKQSATRAGRSAGLFSGAVVAGHMLLLFLSIAAWWRLGDWIGRAWAAVCVAAVWLFIGAVLALLGRREMSAISGLPQTAESIKNIPNAVRGNEEQA